jgi:hypothetical protein
LVHLVGAASTSAFVVPLSPTLCAWDWYIRLVFFVVAMRLIHMHSVNPRRPCGIVTDYFPAGITFKMLELFCHIDCIDAKTADGRYY